MDGGEDRAMGVGKRISEKGRNQDEENKERSPTRPYKLVSSRFNAIAEDNHRLILYNSYTGAIGAIPGEARSYVRQVLKNGIEVQKPDGIIEDLLAGGFLIPEGTDELQRASELYRAIRPSTGLLHLILMSTEECNFRCVYCYETFKLKKMSEPIRRGVKLFVRNQASSLKKLTISWFGGEPLEGLDVITELSRFFINLSKDSGFLYDANITTNGYKLTVDVAKVLLELGVRKFQVTLDGPCKEHDRRRKLVSGEGTFHKIIENLQALRDLQEDYEMHIRVNFDRESVGTIPEFIDSLTDLFAKDPRFSVYFRPVGRWGGPDDPTLPVCDMKAGLQAALRFYERASRQGLTTQWLQKHLSPAGYVCYAALPHSFLIRADGRVGKCTVALEDETNSVGRLLPNGRMILDQDKLALWVSHDESADRGCQMCFFRPVCQGAACPWIRIRQGRRPCPPEKVYIRQVLLSLGQTRSSAPNSSPSPRKVEPEECLQ